MASTEEDLFDLIATTDVPRGSTALLEDQPWLATDRDEDGVSALMRARYRWTRRSSRRCAPTWPSSTSSSRRRSAIWTG